MAIIKHTCTHKKNTHTQSAELCSFPGDLGRWKRDETRQPVWVKTRWPVTLGQVFFHKVRVCVCMYCTFHNYILCVHVCVFSWMQSRLYTQSCHSAGFTEAQLVPSRPSVIERKWEMVQFPWSCARKEGVGVYTDSCRWSGQQPPRVLQVWPCLRERPRNKGNQISSWNSVKQRVDLQ